MKKKVMAMMLSAMCLTTGSMNGLMMTSAAEIQNDENTSIIIGDINNDGKFNIADVVTFQKWLLGSKDISVANWKAADLIADEKLDIFDLTLMKQILIKELKGTPELNNPEIEDMNSYLVLGSDALREIVLQRYELADNSSTSSICNSFSQEELISQIHFMCPFNTATTFYQLDKFYPIEYLHIPDSDKGVGYCIYKLNEGGKLFVFFDDNPDGLYFVTNIFVVKDLLTQDNFSELQIGMTLEDVEKIDSGTKVLNSINDDYLCFCQTIHIVKDGFIQIKYTKKGDTHNSVNDHSNLIISSIEFIQNGGFIEFPNELDYDYVKGGMKYFIEEDHVR